MSEVHFKYEVGHKIVIHHPGDKYHGKTAVIQEIDPKDKHELTYRVVMQDEKGEDINIPLWLPERRIRPFGPKSFYALSPGDRIKNQAGLEFEILEPTEPVYFIIPVGASAGQYITAGELINYGFTIVEKES